MARTDLASQDAWPSVQPCSSSVYTPEKWQKVTSCRCCRRTTWREFWNVWGFISRLLIGQKQGHSRLPPRDVRQASTCHLVFQSNVHSDCHHAICAGLLCSHRLHDGYWPVIFMVLHSKNSTCVEKMLLVDNHNVMAAWSLTPPEDSPILSVLHYGASETLHLTHFKSWVE